MALPVSKSAKGVLFVLGAALFWSLGGVLIKLVPWNPMAIAGIRSLIAFLFTCLVSGDWKIRFTKTNLLGGLGLCGTAFLFIYANKYTTAANAIVLQYTAPVYIILFSAIFFKKKPTKIDLLGVAIIMSGIVLFFMDDLSGGQMLGNIFSLLSGVCFAGMFFINSAPGATPIEATKLGHVIGACIGTPFAFASNGVTLEITPWLAIAAMGIFQLGLAYVLFSQGSPLIPALMASLISFVEPILNPIWVMLAIGETPGPWAILGIVVVISGIILYNVLTARLNKNSTIEPNSTQ